MSHLVSCLSNLLLFWNSVSAFLLRIWHWHLKIKGQPFYEGPTNFSLLFPIIRFQLWTLVQIWQKWCCILLRGPWWTHHYSWCWYLMKVLSATRLFNCELNVSTIHMYFFGKKIPLQKHFETRNILSHHGFKLFIYYFCLLSSLLFHGSLILRPK